MSNAFHRLTRSARFPKLLPALFACVLLLSAGRAWAVRGQVVDAGEFFKPETQDQAEQVIRDIKQRFGKDVMVETYPAIPAELRAAYERKGKANFYSDWSNQRFRALHVNGIYILITRNPGRLEIAVGNVTQQEAFTLGDRDELVALMIEPFRAGKYDEALLNGMDFIRARMERNAVVNGPAPEPLPPGVPGPAVPAGPVPAPGPEPAPAPGPEPAPSNPAPAPSTEPVLNPAIQPVPTPVPEPLPEPPSPSPTTRPAEPTPAIHLPPAPETGPDETPAPAPPTTRPAR